MTRDELEGTIQSGKWFSMLGTFSARGNFVAITDLDAWVAHTEQCTAENFALASPVVADGEQVGVLRSMKWLPTFQSAEDPFHARRLADRIMTDGNGDLLKSWRLDLCKTAQARLRDIEPTPWLNFGATDFSETAKQALLFAIRMAAAEIVADESGIWCTCCDLYASGHWPMGTLPNGEIVVL